MGDWDDSLKMFINENAQDFAMWVLGGIDVEVKNKLLTEFKVRTIAADSLLEVETEDMHFLVHFELQSSRDPRIGERLLHYNVEAQHLHELLVLSCVIYLQDVGEVPQPPLRWVLPNGRKVLRFDYMSIELHKIPTEELRKTGLIGLLPLLILTKDGTTQKVMEEVVIGLRAAEKTELLSVTKILAGLVFTSEDDLEWIERIFAMSNNALEQSVTYQQILRRGLEQGREEGLEQGREEGLEQGREEGMAKGKLEGLRQAVVDVVQERFPKIVSFARKQVEGVEDATLLRHLIVKISAVATAEEAIETLAMLDSEPGKN